MGTPLNVRFTLSEANKDEINENIEKALNLVAQGSIYEIHIKPPRRSYSQNDYAHALISQIAEKTGYTPEEANYWVKGELLGWGTVTIRGKSMPQPKATATLTVDEMSVFIQRLEVLDAEL